MNRNSKRFATGQRNLFGELFSDDPSSPSLEPTTTGSGEPFDSATPVMMLSLWNPWASLCVWTNPLDGLAEKQVETRHWQTSYRDWLQFTRPRP